MESVITEISTIIECFGSLVGIAVLCSIISGYIITWFNIKSENRQWTSWVVSLCVTAVAWLIGYFLNFGIFSGFDVTNWVQWVMTIVTALLGGLLANGIYDIETVKKIFDWIGAFPGKKDELPEESESDPAN